MVFNLNIVDLTIALNYLQFHHVINTSDKDYSFHKFFKSATTSCKI